jgi:hypothetical protein
MRRQCARPGCSAVATTTFTFDSHEQIVFLDTPRDGGARAGELCARHARALAPPRGWRIVDRCQAPGTGAAPAHASEPAPPPAVLVPAPAAPPAPTAALGPSAPAPSAVEQWYPRFEPGDTLDGVLDARTPLLSRAFRNVRAV